MSDTDSNKLGAGQAARRRFLKTAGKIAVYTPPAMILMAKPSFAHMKQSGGGEYQGLPLSRQKHHHHMSFLTRLVRHFL